MQIQMLIAWVDRAAGAAIAGVLERDDDEFRIACALTQPLHAAAAAAAQRPHVLLLEIEDRWEQALRLLTQLGGASPETRSLLAYEACTHEQLVEAIRLGACGCVLKTIAPTILAKAVRTLYQGGTWYGR